LPLHALCSIYINTLWTLNLESHLVTLIDGSQQLSINHKLRKLLETSNCALKWLNLTLKSDKNPTFSVPESDETYCPQKPTLSEETPDVGEKCHISHESKEAKQKELLGPELWHAQREEWVSTSKLPTCKPTSQGGWFNSLTESFTRRKSPDNLTRNTAQYSSKQREEYDDINRRVIKLALKKRTPPYPQPLFPVPLSHVVKCAHETWYEENEQWEL